MNLKIANQLTSAEPEIISIQTQIVFNNDITSSVEDVSLPSRPTPQSELILGQSSTLFGHQHRLHYQQHSQYYQQQQTLKESRYRVSHNNHRQWFLHIKNIKPSDRG